MGQQGPTGKKKARRTNVTPLADEVRIKEMIRVR